MATLIRNICTKLYQNRSRFVKDMTKRFQCVFGSQLQLPFACKTQILTFTRQLIDIIQVRWKTFTFLYDKSTQDDAHQSLSQSVWFKFVEDMTKTFCCVFFSSQCILVVIAWVSNFELIGFVHMQFGKQCNFCTCLENAYLRPLLGVLEAYLTEMTSAETCCLKNKA